MEVGKSFLWFLAIDDAMEIGERERERVWLHDWLKDYEICFTLVFVGEGLV